jgi:hypothetical protein
MIRDDLTGRKFGKLTVLNQAPNRGKRIYWNVICDCGKKKEVGASPLRDGRTVSCGCIRIIHGLCNTKIHSIWNGMRQRCNNPKNPRYHQYGGRGIKICDRWDSFKNFLTDMGILPNGMSLDRIDINGNYEPTNCRWATQFQQSNNMRKNMRLRFKGKVFTLSEISKITGIHKDTLRVRIKRHWPYQKLFNFPKWVRHDLTPSVNKG